MSSDNFIKSSIVTNDNGHAKMIQSAVACDRLDSEGQRDCLWRLQNITFFSASGFWYI